MTHIETKEVAEKLGVSRKTIYRWVRFFNLIYKRNSHGKYEFSESDIQMLQNIQAQLNQGKKLKEVQLNGQPKKQGVDPQMEFKSIKQQIQKLERDMTNKADGVVSTQILLHRREIDELNRTLTNLQTEVEQLEQKISGIYESLEKKQSYRFLSRHRVAR